MAAVVAVAEPERAAKQERERAHAMGTPISMKAKRLTSKIIGVNSIRCFPPYLRTRIARISAAILRRTSINARK